MERRGNRNGPVTSWDGPGTSQNESIEGNIDLPRVIKGTRETQQQQTELLRQSLVTAPWEQSPGNVSDFRRLQPTIFTGEGKPLDAEQWLIDTTDLLIAVHIPADKQVEVAKI